MQRSSLAAVPQAVHIKSQPEDWRVYEHMSGPFSGSGEHAYFYVEKRNLNTQDVVRRLADAFAVPASTLGYAGLKDKVAVTRQWFSVPTPSSAWPLTDPEIVCLDVQRHSRKLRRGEHAYNAFAITLRQSPAVNVEVFSAPFANRFGPQRLSQSNVQYAQAWLQRTYGAQRKPSGKRGRAQARGGRSGWHMSVLRSLLFNAVLEKRIALGNENQALPGEFLLAGKPTGPLWGRGRLPVTEAAAALESAALQPYADICQGLEFSGLQHERRLLTQQAFDFSHTDLGSGNYLLNFCLPPGVYATTLLADKVELVDVSKCGE